MGGGGSGVRAWRMVYEYVCLFFNDTATIEVYAEEFVGSVRCV